jgi:hypothetical protein
MSSSDVALVAVLAGTQVLLFAVMRATSNTAYGDPFDSPLYRWS